MGETLLKRPIATWGLILVNVLTYLALWQELSIDTKGIYNALIAYGALDPARVWSGELWRLFSALFLHAGLLHVGFNLFVLFQIGRLLEPALGTSRFLMVYLISGVVGFACSLLWHSTLVLGASAAVFGLIGAMLAVMLVAPRQLFQPRLVKSLVFFVVLNVSVGVVLNQVSSLEGMVDNAAHLGGLVCGFLFGLAFSKDALQNWLRNTPYSLPHFVPALALGLVTLGSLGLISTAIRPSFMPQYHLLVGQQALLEGRLEEAMQAQQHLRELPGSLALADLLLGRIMSAKGDKKDAEKQFEKALAGLDPDMNIALKRAMWSLQQNIDPQGALFADEKSNAAICKIALRSSVVKDATLLNECAWLLLMAREAEVRDEKLALVWVKKAIENESDQSAQMLHTLSEAYLQNGQFKEAQAAIERALLLANGNRQIARFMVTEKARMDKLVKKMSQLPQNH